MQYQYILFEVADAVAHLSLNRPHKLNALHSGLVNEINHALGRCEQPMTARVLLLTGEGRAFCSGADLSPEAWPDCPANGGEPDAGASLQIHLNPLLERLVALPIPVIAAVGGVAAGAGCSLALAADLVVASRSAYFLQAFINVGLVPDMGATWIMPRLVGGSRAMAMMMLGERISAEQACAWGMIHNVVEDEDLAGAAHSLAARLAQGPTAAYALLRTGLRECMNKSLGEALQIERRNQRLAGLTADFAEGLAAFAEKRPTKFQGR